MRGIAAVLALAGCFFDDLDFHDTHFRCDDGVTCPPGFSCVANQCMKMDAPVVDAPPACGKISLFVDNFDDNVIDTTIWNDNSGAINEIGGAAVATISGSVPVSAYGSSERADLTASSVYVAVLQVTAETFLRVQADDTHFLEIAAKNNALSFKQDGNPMGAIGYDSGLHKWWRISETANMVSFDTSADGNMWMSRATTPTPSYATSVTLQFGARIAQTTGEAHFENLNGGMGGPSGPCGGG